MGYISDSKSYREYMMEMEKQQDDTPQPFKPDSIVQSIINEFLERAKKGKEKYGVDLDRNDLTIEEWIEHAKQEHMDAILYLEKIKHELSGEKVI
jgi:hypothetical protein